MISIIVPVYNTQKYLSECIDSIINQSYKDIELILINDGSTDNSLSICKEYEKQDKRIKLLSIANAGVSHARNIGIKESHGKYILFVDSDDYLGKDVLEKLIKYNDTDIVIYNYYKISEKTIIKCDPVYTISQTKDQFLCASHYNLRTEYYYKIYNKLYKRSIVVENNIIFPEDIAIGEDLRFNLSYFTHCNHFLMISDFLYNYRIDNSHSLMNTIKTINIDTIIKEIKDIIDFYRGNNCLNSSVDKGISNLVVSKTDYFINVLVSMKIKRKILYHTVSLFILTFKDISKDINITFTNVLFKRLLVLGWKKNKGSILYFRTLLINIRYNCIKLLKPQLRGKK